MIRKKHGRKGNSALKQRAGQSSDTSRTRLIKIIAVVVGLLFVMDIFVGGRLNYAFHYIGCGKQPVLAQYQPFFSGGFPYQTYSLPSDDGYDIKPNNKYYCSQPQAEQDGLERVWVAPLEVE